MKKKLIAILSACLVLSSAFISCGKDDDGDSSSRKKNKSSISEDDPKYNENDDEDETTTEEDTTEEDTTEKVTEPVETTTEKTTSGSGSGGSSGSSDGMPVVTRDEAPAPAGGDIKGMWGGFSSDNGADVLLAFEDGGKGALYFDMSSVMYFKSDRSLWMDGITLGKNSVSYDGKTITVKMDADSLGVDPSKLDELDEDTAAMFTQPILILTRTDSADSSTLDGEYKFDGGIFSDQLTQSMMEDSEGVDKDSLRAIIKGEKMLMKFADIVTYTTSGTKLTVSSDNPIFKQEFNESSVDYTVDGDTLYIFDDKDENKVGKLERFTF
ncbi:MAG: hypothetical protein GXY08_02555 [Ruminococcus sp.]|nr:hypothetical protein [Ruminococcus sp.]